MTCEESQEVMMDVLYGEELHPRREYEFFRHLSQCSACDGEYIGFLETRESLSAWDLEEDHRASGAVLPAWKPGLTAWLSWRSLQKVAALILIAAGTASLAQAFWPNRDQTLAVSQQEMAEMVNDLIVIRQAEERQIIGQALISFADELAMQDEIGTRKISDQIFQLEQRYQASLDSLEENNRQLRTLLSR